MATAVQISDVYEYGFHDKEEFVYKSDKGLNEEVVRQISSHKKEPEWMLEFRLMALKVFESKPMPTWGGNLSMIDFDNIYYYLKPTEGVSKTWEEVPESVKRTYDRLGIPEAEKQMLAGVKAQYDSEVVYGSIKKQLSDQGVVFLSMDQGLAEYPELVKKHWATVIPAADNKFAALNSAVWSGGSFIYVPKGVKVDLPLQAYFRINAKNMGQFERTMIIADEGSQVHYVEGCSAPIYSEDSLHAAVVEIVVMKGARVRYTTVQNWSKDVYNLVTKRARVQEDGVMEWIDFNAGSKLTMKYPSVFLVGDRAHGEILSIALAGSGQHLDAGGKAVHAAPNTTSRIVSKSISHKGGRTSYRGLLSATVRAKGARSNVVCDALILDADSASDTYPTIDIQCDEVEIAHEATVSKIGEEQLFYLQSRGIPKVDAEAMIVNGFIEPIVKELPLEYAVELNRLIHLEMEGSVG